MGIASQWEMYLKVTSMVEKQDFVHMVDLAVKTMHCDCCGVAATWLLEAFSDQSKYVLEVLGEITLHELAWLVAGQ